MKLEYNDDWQTQARGTNQDEYQIYLDCADDGTGRESGENYPGCPNPYIKGTGPALKTYEEWLAS